MKIAQARERSVSEHTGVPLLAKSSTAGYSTCPELHDQPYMTFETRTYQKILQIINRLRAFLARIFTHPLVAVKRVSMICKMRYRQSFGMDTTSSPAPRSVPIKLDPSIIDMHLRGQQTRLEQILCHAAYAQGTCIAHRTRVQKDNAAIVQAFVNNAGTYIKLPGYRLINTTLLQDIAIACPNVTHLDLTDAHRLKTLPPDIGAFTKLTKLTLRNLGLEELPATISDDLPKLQELVLDQNALKCFPQAVCTLRKLVLLSCRENQLRKIPDEDLRKLINLKTLKLDGNPLLTLPQDAIRYLHNLRWLSLNDTHIEMTMPEKIGHLNKHHTRTGGIVYEAASRSCTRRTPCAVKHSAFPSPLTTKFACKR